MSIQNLLTKPVYNLEGFSLYANTEPPNGYQAHAHAELEIFILLNHAFVEAKWGTDKDLKCQSQTVQAGQLCIIPSHQPHEINWQQEAEYIIMFLHPSFLRKAAQMLIPNNIPIIAEQYAIDDTLLLSLGMALYSAFQDGATMEHLYIDSLVNLLAVHLLRNYGTPLLNPQDKGREHQQWLASVLHHIHHSLDQDLRLAKLANLAQMSESSFSHQFKHHMQTSPHRYIIQKRIELATKLLRQRELSITEVALQCGFNSQSHLNIHFRQQTGMTPKAYQNSCAW